MRLLTTILLLVSAASGQVFLGGQLNISGDIQAFENAAFTCTPVQPLRKGDVLAARVSQDLGLSIDTAGDRQRVQDQKGYETKGRTSPSDLTPALAKYPVILMARTQSGFVGLFPAVLKVKVDIGTGTVLRSGPYQIGGYQIEATRVVKAGESIPVLVAADAILSIEGAKAATKDGDATPWFVAVKDGADPQTRAAAIQAWRTESKLVSQ
jgi:hypothetical protein